MDDEFEPNKSDSKEPREFRVDFTGTATTYVTVMATNATDAVNAAEDLVSSSLCWQCSHPKASGFHNTGAVEREYPDYMEVDQVRTDDGIVDPGDY